METETYTVRLVVPKGLIPSWRTIKEVRSVALTVTDDWIGDTGKFAFGSFEAPHLAGSLRIILEPLPTWTPPASLSDGLYRWEAEILCYDGGTMTKPWLSRVLRDWTDPPLEGRWKIENGKATYLGA